MKQTIIVSVIYLEQLIELKKTLNTENGKVWYKKYL